MKNQIDSFKKEPESTILEWKSEISTLDLNWSKSVVASVTNNIDSIINDELENLKLELIPDFFKIQWLVMDFWDKNRIYERSIEERPENNPYRFFDGPPFVNGTPHYGHLLASTVKDVVCRYWTMHGYRVERKWWWDCHGLPIETKVQKKFWLEKWSDIESFGIRKFVDECHKYTSDISNQWDWYIANVGRGIDMKNCYKTMDENYMESVIWAFKELYSKWLVYKGKRVSYYSTKLSTPISNFEVTMDNSYQEVEDPELTIEFDLSINGEKWKNCSILAWTTTPWTLPSNVALAVNENISYAEILKDWKRYILSEKQIEYFFKEGEFQIIRVFLWSELTRLKYTPIFDYYNLSSNQGKEFHIYHADFISEKDGTGVAHQAPEFWEEDFSLGKKYDLTLTESMDQNGVLNSQLGKYWNRYYLDINNDVISELQERGILFKKGVICHQVAICPRSGARLVYKVQDSWFIDIQNHKNRLLEKNEEINWQPEFLKHWRFANSIKTAPDWCISRNRYWGTPMPVWIGYDVAGNEVDMKIFWSIKEIEQNSGKKVESLHRPYIDEIKWEKNGIFYKRIPEVLDVWMDSACMPMAQVHYPFENQETFSNSYPADFLTEYIWQIRAWFYVMHVIGVYLFDKPSFKNALTTGTLLWTDGRKMSKSFGNYPDPDSIIKKYGGDFFRIYTLWSVLMNWGEMIFKDEEIKEAGRKYIFPLWNSFYFYETYAETDKFLPRYGTVTFFSDAKSIKAWQKYNLILVKSKSALEECDIPLGMRVVEYEDDLELVTSLLDSNESQSIAMVGDKDIISALIFQRLSLHLSIDIGSDEIILPNFSISNVLDKGIMIEFYAFMEQYHLLMKTFDFKKLLSCLEEFLETLTNKYIRRSKKRFWRWEMDVDKKQAYVTLHFILENLSQALSPLAPFISEFIFKKLTKKESVHLMEFDNKFRGFSGNSKLSEELQKLDEIIEIGLFLRENNWLPVKQPLLQITISINIDPDIIEILKKELNVKEILIDDSLKEITKKRIILNSKKLWPTLKGKMNDLLEASRNGNYIRTDDGLEICWITLSGDDFSEVNEKIENSNISSNGKIVMKIDTNLSKELLIEGEMRKLLRNLQNVRKQAELNVSDRIEFYFEGITPTEVIEKYGEFIEKETLSIVRKSPLANYDYKQELNFGWYNFVVYLKKIS